MRSLPISVLLLAMSPVRAQDIPNYPPPAQVRAAFLKTLDRPKLDPVINITETKTMEGFALESFAFDSEKKADGTIERVPTLILKPANAKGKLPAVIVLHGTG